MLQRLFWNKLCPSSEIFVNIFQNKRLHFRLWAFDMFPIINKLYVQDRLNIIGLKAMAMAVLKCKRLILLRDKVRSSWLYYQKGYAVQFFKLINHLLWLTMFGNSWQCAKNANPRFCILAIWVCPFPWSPSISSSIRLWQSQYLTECPGRVRIMVAINNTSILTPACSG